eukprot:4433695-Amphidinium_carterae.1
MGPQARLPSQRLESRCDVWVVLVELAPVGLRRGVSRSCVDVAVVHAGSFQQQECFGHSA